MAADHPAGVQDNALETISPGSIEHAEAGQEVPDEKAEEEKGENEANEDDGGEDEDEDEDEDPLLKFQNVIGHLDLDSLQKFSVRMRTLQAKDKPEPSEPLTCTVKKDPLCGSFNIVYILQFSDGLQWVARIGVDAAEMDDLSTQCMVSQYCTMRYIKKMTSIPIAEVYYFETTSETIGVPFALMSYINGASIGDRWDDESWITEEKRLKILANIARVMAKLQTMKFEKTGALYFAEDNSLSHIGPLFRVTYDPSSYDETGEIETSQVGPFQSYRDWLYHFWDDLEGVEQHKDHQELILTITRLVVESIPSYFDIPDRCTIDTLDFNYQNIFIDDDCSVTGMIDFDCICTKPAGFGCTRYPSWITRDWDLGTYDLPEDGDWENSTEDPPEKLKAYRKHYAEAFAEAKPKNYDVRETTQSQILEAIKLAVLGRFERRYIMMGLLNYAFKGVWSASTEHFMDVLKALDGTEEEVEEIKTKVTEAFRNMWHTEWQDDEEPSREANHIEDVQGEGVEANAEAEPQVKEARWSVVKQVEHTWASVRAFVVRGWKRLGF